MVQPETPRTALFFTALPEEANAVLAYLDETSAEVVGTHVFEVGDLSLDDGASWRIGVVELGPGNIDTAGVVAPAATHFKPEAMFFVGIAGALKDDDVNIGDVVAGASVSWTERAKDAETGRFDRVLIANASAFITSVARKVARRGDWTSRVLSDVRHPDLKAVVGQIASGEKVIANEARKAEIRLVHSDAIAIENEGYGFTRASSSAADAAEYMTIRGICDKADATKDDEHHVLAAQTAAAFAFELLHIFSSLMSVSSLREEPAPAPKTPYVRREDVNALFAEFLDDEEIVDDEQGEVERYARNLIDRPGFDLESAIIRILHGLNGPISEILGRRLEWVGRLLVGCDAGEPSILETDEFYREVRDHERGAARALLHSSVWTSLPERIRRRLLTAVLGPSGEPHAPDAVGTRLLVPLIEGDLLDDNELVRFENSIRSASYETLSSVGIPLEFLIPRIIDDLNSGDFDRQNPAARHLYRTEEASAASAAIRSFEDIALGSALVDAAPEHYPSNGAREALSLSRLVGWSVSRLAGGIWASVTRGDRRCLTWPPSVRLNNLIAAASAKDVLPQVLEVVRTLPTSDMERPHASTIEMLLDSLAEIAEELSGDDRAAFDGFAAWLEETTNTWLS